MFGYVAAHVWITDVRTHAACMQALAATPAGGRVGGAGGAAPMARDQLMLLRHLLRALPPNTTTPVSGSALTVPPTHPRPCSHTPLTVGQP
eukprot:364039-Chlamydomonas_euryale.AAC.4